MIVTKISYFTLNTGFITECWSLWDILNCYLQGKWATFGVNLYFIYLIDLFGQNCSNGSIVFGQKDLLQSEKLVFNFFLENEKYF